MTTANAFWDKRSKKYDVSAQKHGAIFKKRMQRLQSLLNEQDIVLDFACATGEISRQVAPMVGRLHGIDYSEKMIALAQSKEASNSISNLQFSVGDGFEPHLKANSFTAILAFNIFHLVEDPAKVLARLHQLLDAGGILITQTPCLAERNGFLQWLIRLAIKANIAPMIHSFKVTDLESLISANNFQILESESDDTHHSAHWILAKKR